MFLRAHIKGATLEHAYLSVLPDNHPTLADGTARNLGSRMLKRIRGKVDWPRLMESAGLGEMRLLVELEKRYGAMETHFWQDTEVATVEDNGTRMRATELHADLLGKRKTEINLKGEIVVDLYTLTPEERKARIEDLIRKREERNASVDD